jgi:hypothetical protein
LPWIGDNRASIFFAFAFAIALACVSERPLSPKPRSRVTALAGPRAGLR